MDNSEAQQPWSGKNRQLVHDGDENLIVDICWYVFPMVSTPQSYQSDFCAVHCSKLPSPAGKCFGSIRLICIPSLGLPWFHYNLTQWTFLILPSPNQPTNPTPHPTTISHPRTSVAVVRCMMSCIMVLLMLGIICAHGPQESALCSSRGWRGFTNEVRNSCIIYIYIYLFS